MEANDMEHGQDMEANDMEFHYKPNASYLNLVYFCFLITVFFYFVLYLQIPINYIYICCNLFLFLIY